MTEEEFKDLFYKYIIVEMKLLPKSENIPEHPPYSRKFNKKIKHLMRAGDRYGGNLYVYNFIRKAVAVLLIIFSLAVANQASAAILGFNPWVEVNRMLRKDIGMEQKTYEKTNSIPDNPAKPLADVPTYLPDGYVEIDYHVGESILTAEWEKVESDGLKYGLSYSRDTVDRNVTYMEDIEYDDIYTTSVMNFSAEIFIKKDEIWIRWKDTDYRYMILTNSPRIEKSELKRIAESIYEKK